MIIWGLRWRDKILSSGTFFCPNCNQIRPYKRKRPGYYFSLFFLPLIRLRRRSPVVECQVCKSRFDPKVLDTDSQGTFQLVASTRYALLHGTSPNEAKSHLISQGIEPQAADRLIEMAQR